MHLTIRHIAAAAMSVAALTAAAQTSGKLTGKIIGTEFSVDYTTGERSSRVNTKAEAFDGDFNTCFASYDRSFTWVGLDLGEPHVITRVGFAARNDGLGPQRMQLGVFQGANEADFSDAMPIYMIKEYGKIGEMTYADVSCSKGFRYVRYVGPNDSRCNVAELDFEGYAGQGDETALYQPTNLPLVVVNTPGMEWFHDYDKSYEMNGSMVYIIDGGKVDTGATAQIRGRGNASWGFPKKPFRIKFDKKQTVLGGPAKAKKWTMINNYGDKTLMRNMLAFEISRRLGLDFTPVCHPVDLIFNGEYQGTYQLCDQVEVNDNRVAITEMKASDTAGDALTGGYLIEIDAYADQEPADEWFYSQGGHYIPVTIKSPDAGVTQQYNYIRNYFTKLERAVFASNFTDPVNGYRKYLDLDSFLRHFIVGELSGNTDTYWSVYMSLDRGATQFRTGPCWDFDLAFNNDVRTYPVNNKSDFVCFSGGSFANGMYDFVYRIIRADEGARQRLSYIWSDARVNHGISAPELTALVDEYADMLAQSQELNFKRWPILNTAVHQNPRAWGSYATEVQVVRSYLNGRVPKLDGLIGLVEVEGVESIDRDDCSVVAADGAIVITGDESYTIYNMHGITVAAGRGNASVAVDAGIYIVRHGDSISRVIVK